MRTTLKVLACIIGFGLGIYGAFSFRAVISEKFSWDSPFAFLTAIAATFVVLLLANAVFHFKRDHPKLYGLFQILIGCGILLSQMGTGHPSDPNQEAFAVKFFGALFFLVQGLESWRSAREAA
jgi:hypothetical protein